MESKHRGHTAVIAIVALVVSIMSFIVSGATFYFNHLRKYEDLKGTIVSMRPNYPIGAQFTADIVFTNNGNRKCSIVSMSLEQENLDAKGFLLNSPSLMLPPFTINESDVVTKQVQIGGGKIFSRNLDAKEGDRVEWRLVFRVVDSSGRFHETTVPVLFKTIGQGSEDTFEIARTPTTVQLLPSRTVEFNRYPPNIIEQQPGRGEKKTHDTKQQRK